MQANYEKDLRGCLEEMGDLARAIALKYFRTDLSITDKRDLSPVTIADQEIEHTIKDFVRKRFPGHGFIGEEYGQEKADAEFVWVIDPIDGTKAFATGKPLFGTIIGLLQNGKATIGMIDQAFTKERWIGSINDYCTHNSNHITVSPLKNLSAARFYTAAPEMFDGECKDNFEKLRKAVKWTMYGADCYAYGLLAMGQVDLVIERGLAVHDLIGLVPVVKGAGGYIADWNGNDISINSNGTVVAANSKELALTALAILTS
jgi:histidinol phosphatase-like enzyme (inositol monophosphatase family)